MAEEKVVFEIVSKYSGGAPSHSQGPLTKGQQQIWEQGLRSDHRQWKRDRDIKAEMRKNVIHQNQLVDREERKQRMAESKKERENRQAARQLDAQRKEAHRQNARQQRIDDAKAYALSMAKQRRDYALNATDEATRGMMESLHRRGGVASLGRAAIRGTASGLAESWMANRNLNAAKIAGRMRSMARLAGPTVLATGAFALASALAAAAGAAWSYSKAARAAETAAIYNGAASGAKAYGEYRRTMGDIQRSNTYGPALANFSTSRTDLGETIEDLKWALMSEFLPSITASMTALNDILSAVQFLNENVPNAPDAFANAMATVFGLDERAARGFREIMSGPLQTAIFAWNQLRGGEGEMSAADFWNAVDPNQGTVGGLIQDELTQMGYTVKRKGNAKTGVSQVWKAPKRKRI